MKYGNMPVLAALLNELADWFEGTSDLSELAARLEDTPQAEFRRYYYLAILGRSPENELLARETTTNRLETALEFLSSDEFMVRHINVFRDMFPSIKAEIFLHIPKSGGTTILEAQRSSDLYAFIRNPEAAMAWESNRLSYLGHVMSALRTKGRKIAISGHPTAQLLITHRILGPDDEIYTILRNPLSTVVSYLNYVLTSVALQRPHDSVDRWSQIIDIPNLCTGKQIPVSVLLKILKEIVPKNVICMTLAANNWAQAVRIIQLLGIQVFFFEDLDSILIEKNFPTDKQANKSFKFVDENALSHELASAIAEHISEDIKLYRWAVRRKETGLEDLPQDEQVPRQAGAGMRAASSSSAAVNPSDKLVFHSSELDAFVAETDRRGHVGSQAVTEFWGQCEFTHETNPDQTLDPFGVTYVGQQLDLYRELSGRDLDQSVNELVAFDLPAHASAVNPYAHLPAHDVAKHVARLSCGLMQSNLPAGGSLLDIGCGWGLSSEVFAYTGLHVTAVDINPAFVELVNHRARSRSLHIEAVQGTFEALPQGPFDAAAYYECLHHAVRPWEALEAVAKVLRAGGKLLIVGEPISNYWKNWGLRQDPLSIYCIRKFGWFESGWSLQFLRNCIERSGFRLSFCNEAGEKIGWVIVAERL